MNGLYILSWLIEDAESNGSEFYNGIHAHNPNPSIKDMLLELNNRKPLQLSEQFFDTINKSLVKGDASDEENLISSIKNVFKNDIISISLVLTIYFLKNIFILFEYPVACNLEVIIGIIQECQSPAEGRSAPARSS
jgi:hypothetical protein